MNYQITLICWVARQNKAGKNNKHEAKTIVRAPRKSRANSMAVPLEI